MHHFTDPQLAALRTARDGGGLRKTNRYWHARLHMIDTTENNYWPDGKSVFTDRTILALNTHGMLDGNGKITPEGLAVLAESRRSVLRDIEGKFAAGAVDARNALQARRR
jgi:hypothetical protein